MWQKYKYLFTCAGCLLLLLSLNGWQHSSATKNKKAHRIQAELNLEFESTYQKIKISNSPVTLGKELALSGIKYFFQTQDSLLYWNENDAQFETSAKAGFITADSKQYYRHSWILDDKTHTVYIPVAASKEFNNKDLLSPVLLLSPDKKSNTHVSPKDPDPRTEWFTLLLYILFIFSSLFLSFQWSEYLRKKEYIILSLLSFTIGLFGFRLLSLWLTKSTIFSSIFLFTGSEKPSLLSPTLGDLLVNILILCVLVWYVRRFVKPHYFNRDKSQNKVIAILNYGLVYISALLMVQIYRQLVIGSGISFDFEYIFYLDIKSLLALVGILTLAIALFLLDLHLLRIIRHLGLSAAQRLSCNVTAILFVLVILKILPISIPAIIFLGLASYLTLLDISIDYYKPNSSWYLVWTLTGSILVSSLLFLFHYERDLDQRTLIASDLNLELSALTIASIAEKEERLTQTLNRIEDNSLYLAMYDLKYSADFKLNNYANKYTPIGSTGFYITKKTNTLFKIFSFFSYIFILFNLLLITLHIINKKYKWFSISIIHFFPEKQTLRYRIQSSILYMSIGSFLLIASVITFYIKQTAGSWNTSRTEHNITKVLDLNSNSNTQVIYTKEGLLLPNYTSRMDFDEWATLHSIESPYKQHLENGQTYFFKNVLDNNSTQIKRKLNDFLGTLLNVYVFLLLLMVVVSFMVSNSIIKPLTLLSSKLKQIQVGGTNQRLEWNNNDELGALIRNYNEMIQELDRSTRMLALTERETAWREMAKQVAHEIKNPLTPMKLITQHLQNSIGRAEPHEVSALVKRVTTTLIEQIENLSKIASEFSNFAKLPSPENEKMVMNEVVTSTHDLFRKREDMDIHLRVPIDEIYVFADKNHIIRVLTNLIKNAIQSIPLGRRGRIEILLYKQNEKAIVKVSDNGCGIPESMKDKVFYPNFTTKNSGTGLGLAIVRDIIDSCNGHIYFYTTENKGTEFYVELPLMHMKDNFIEEKRVSL